MIFRTSPKFGQDIFKLVRTEKGYDTPDLRGGDYSTINGKVRGYNLLMDRKPEAGLSVLCGEDAVRARVVKLWNSRFLPRQKQLDKEIDGGGWRS